MSSGVLGFFQPFCWLHWEEILIRFVKFSCDGASDRGRWRTGRRLCCQHRAGVRWQGGLGGQVCLLRWKFHQGNQRHQRCRDTDPEDQESGGDLQCQCLLVITFILFCNVLVNVIILACSEEMRHKNAQVRMRKNAQEVPDDLALVLKSFYDCHWLLHSFIASWNAGRTQSSSSPLTPWRVAPRSLSWWRCKQQPNSILLLIWFDD